MTTLPIPIRCTLTDGAVAPVYAKPGDSGLDLRAVAWRRYYEGTEVRRRGAIDLDPGERVLVYTGLAIELPDYLEAQVRPRSGLSLRHGVTCHLGTIDAGYRGEIGVCLVNTGDSHVTLDMGERVAQLVVAPVVRVQLDVVEALGETTRGVGGFGSTGRL